MKVICSYCKCDMGQREPVDDPSTSHGICAECVSYYERQWDGLSLGEYLDIFAAPVLVVNHENRVLAVNEPMARQLGCADRAVAGLLGGEVMECVYARLEGGCGGTVHCTTCTVRNVVQRTLETGEPQERVPAWVDRDDGRLELHVSTQIVRGAVFVILHGEG